MVKTNVHFPTDINLLFDAIRKVIQLIAEISERHKIKGWRQYQYNIKAVKKAYRKAQKSKKSNRRKEQERQSKIQEAHEEYIKISEIFLKKAIATIEIINKKESILLIDQARVTEIEEYLIHAERQIDQIRRRVLNGEVIPHKEKVFSIFEPHTEWICKGKAGVPVELGVRVCIVEDKNQFILHHKIMWKQTDDKLTIIMAEETKKKFPELHSMSYDRGFYSINNREQIAKILDSYALPKKGKLSKADKEIQNSEEYINAKEKHSAVESAINALDHHGLDKCPDHGKVGFERYVTIAIVARNIQRIGYVLHKKEQHLLALRKNREKIKAA